MQIACAGIDGMIEVHGSQCHLSFRIRFDVRFFSPVGDGADAFAKWFQQQPDACTATLSESAAQLSFETAQTEVNKVQAELERVRARLDLAETKLGDCRLELQETHDIVDRLREQVTANMIRRVFLSLSLSLSHTHTHTHTQIHTNT